MTRTRKTAKRTAKAAQDRQRYKRTASLPAPDLPDLMSMGSWAIPRSNHLAKLVWLRLCYDVEQTADPARDRTIQADPKAIGMATLGRDDPAAVRSIRAALTALDSLGYVAKSPPNAPKHSHVELLKPWPEGLIRRWPAWLARGDLPVEAKLLLFWACHYRPTGSRKVEATEDDLAADLGMIRETIRKRRGLLVKKGLLAWFEPGKPDCFGGRPPGRLVIKPAVPLDDVRRATAKASAPNGSRDGYRPSPWDDTWPDVLKRPDLLPTRKLLWLRVWYQSDRHGEPLVVAPEKIAEGAGLYGRRGETYLQDLYDEDLIEKSVDRDGQWRIRLRERPAGRSMSRWPAELCSKRGVASEGARLLYLYLLHTSPGRGRPRRVNLSHVAGMIGLSSGAVLWAIHQLERSGLISVAHPQTPEERQRRERKARRRTATGRRKPKRGRRWDWDIAVKTTAVRLGQPRRTVRAKAKPAATEPAAAPPPAAPAPVKPDSPPPAGPAVEARPTHEVKPTAAAEGEAAIVLSMPDDAITAAVAVKEFAVSRATLKRHRKAGKIRAYREPGAVKTAEFSYSKAELARCFQQRRNLA